MCTNADKLAKTMLSKSALGASYAMTIIDESWYESNYAAVKTCLKSMAEGFFMFSTRNLFHCTATRLIIEILNSKSASVEKLQMREHLLDDIKIGTSKL